MQIFVRCGAPVGTVAVECQAAETSIDVKARLCDRHQELGPPNQLRLIYGGYQLGADRQLRDVPGLGLGSTLHLSGRLRGGGGDGGSTGAESRSCYLEMYLGKKGMKVNPAEELLANWTRCHVSGDMLSPPCVIDEVGYVYNKEAILQHLVNKTMPTSLAYITGLKSVMEIKLHREQTKQRKAATQVSFQPGNDTDFCCPVTGLPFNGRGKFVAIRPSGVVVSEKALKEVPAVVEELVGGKWTDEDVIMVNPTGEALEQQRAKAASKLAAARDKKKGKKGSTATTANGAAADGAAAAAVGEARKRSASPPADPAAAAAAAKKVKTLEHAPAGANKSVYASLFLSSSDQKDVKETFCCRALSARGVNLS